MPGRLYDMQFSQVEQMLRKLVAEGLNAGMAEAILTKPNVAKDWVANLREQLKPPAPPFDQLFRSTPDVLEAFLVRSKQRGWGFNSEHIDALRRRPIPVMSSLSQVVTLDIWLGDLQTTLEELWAWVVNVYVRTWRYDGLKFDKEHLRLLNPERYGTQPSVRWVALDVTANWDKKNGIRPRDVRDPANSAGLQVLSAAVLHPDWPPAVNYDTVPGVWLPGLQVTVPNKDPWSNVPILNWDRFNGTVRLLTHSAGIPGSHYAVPVVKEL